MRKQKCGFTVVELIAVIVVLAIILAITVPSITGVIRSSTMKAVESDAKLVLDAIRVKKVEDNTFDPTQVNEENINSLLGLSNENYSALEIQIDDGKTYIQMSGKGKWEGLSVCGTFFDVEVNEGSCHLDFNPPVIILTGDNLVTIEVGSVYTDAGAVAIDDIDGDITNRMMVTGSVNPNAVGTYTIAYDVSDSAGLVATQVTRTINVIDTNAPTVLFGTNGNDTYAKTRNTTVTLYDTGGIDITSCKYQWATSTTTPSEDSFTMSFINGGIIETPFAVTGGYYLWVLVKDSSLNTTIIRSNIFNLDNTIPVITMNGSNNININKGSTYSDAGATATDNIDGTLTVNASGTVNVNVVGEYQVTYTATDSSGNQAIPVVRTIIVRDVVAPEITILGSNPYSLNVGNTYVDPGATAMDDVDGNVTSRIQTTSNVNTNLPGTYTVTYTVKDNANNTATRTRTVTIIQPYSCSIGTLVNHATYGNICTVTAASQNWTSTQFVCTATAEQPVYESYQCCTYTCEQSCYAGYAACGYCAEFGIDGCLGACWIGGCITWGTCTRLIGTQTVCTAGYNYQYYYCASGWSTYSGSSGSDLVCYRAATQG